MEAAAIYVKLALQTKEYAESLSRSGKEAAKFADGLKTAVAVGATAAVASLALVVGAAAAVGTAAVDMASQVRASTNQIEASLGATKAEAEALGQVAVNVFANNFGASIDETTAAVIEARQQLGDLADNELQAAAENAFRLKDVFGVEIPESMNAAKALTEQFGLSQQEAFDFIAKGFQSGLNSSDDFLESITEYSNLFAQGGASAAEMFSTFQTGLQAGVLGTDKAGDLFKEFSIRVQDGSDATAEALATIQGPTEDIIEEIRSGGLSVSDAFTMIKDRIADLDDPLQQQALGVALFGTQWEDLGTSVALGIDPAMTALADMAGATDTLNAKYNTFGAMWEGIKRQALVALIPIGDRLLELANSTMPYVQMAFSWLETNLPLMVDGALAAFDRLLAMGPGLVTAIQPVLGVWQQFTSLMSGETTVNFGIFSATIERIQLGFQQFLVYLQPIVPIWQQFMAQLQMALPGLQTLGTIIGGVLVAALIALGEVVAGLLPAVGAALTAIVGTATSLIGGLITFVAGAVEMFVGLFTGDLDRARAGAVQVIEGLVTAIVGPITYLGTWLATAFDAAVGNVIAVWEYLYNVLVGHSIIPDLVAAIIAVFAGLLTPLVNTFYQIRDGLVQTVSDMAGKLLESFEEMLAGIKEVFKADEWLKIGKDIVMGVKQGISDNASAVYEVLKSMAKNAIQSAKDALWSNSPSRKFIQIGEDTVLGFIRGVDNKANSLATKIQDTIAVPLKALRKNLTNFITTASKDGGLNDIWDQNVIDDIQRAVRVNADRLALGVAELSRANNISQQSLERLILDTTGVWPNVARDLAAAMFKSNGDVAGIVSEMVASQSELIAAVAEAQAQFNLDKLNLGSGLAQLGGTALERFGNKAAAAAAKINAAFGEIGEEGLAATDVFREINAMTLKLIRSNTPGFEAITNQEQERLRMLKELGMEVVGGNRAEYEKILQVARELNKVEEERAALAKQQADLQYLQQQLSLLQTLRDFGIDPKDIFGGLQFGLEASLPDLVAATRRAMEAIIGTVDKDMQIASPSKVMIKRGKQIMAGLQKPLQEMALRIPALAELAGGGSTTNTTNEYHLHYSGSAPGNVRDDFRLMQATVGAA